MRYLRQRTKKTINPAEHRKIQILIYIILIPDNNVNEHKYREYCFL